MFYVNIKPNNIGNHGNPVSNYSDGLVALPDEFVTEYINAMGFVYLSISDDTVTSIEINQQAYDDYQESLPEPEPQPEPMTQAEVEEMLLDQEYRILLLEYGLEDIE